MYRYPVVTEKERGNVRKREREWGGWGERERDRDTELTRIRRQVAGRLCWNAKKGQLQYRLLASQT